MKLTELMARNQCNYEQLLSNKGIFTAPQRAERFGRPRMKKVDVDNFLLENNHVLWGKKGQQSDAQQVTPVASGVTGGNRCG